VFSFFFLLGGGGYLAAKTLLESNSGTPAPEGSAPDMPSNMSGSQIASVRFEGLPPDTRLRVDGSAVSPSGETYLSAGTHKLQAEAAGFTSYEGALVVKAGEIRSVKIPLKAKSP
jgi:hypothetical protein